MFPVCATDIQTNTRPLVSRSQHVADGLAFFERTRPPVILSPGRSADLCRHALNCRVVTTKRDEAPTDAGASYAVGNHLPADLRRFIRAWGLVEVGRSESRCGTEPRQCPANAKPRLGENARKLTPRAG